MEEEISYCGAVAGCLSITMLGAVMAPLVAKFAAIFSAQFPSFLGVTEIEANQSRCRLAVRCCAEEASEADYYAMRTGAKPARAPSRWWSQ